MALEELRRAFFVLQRRRKKHLSFFSTKLIPSLLSSYFRRTATLFLKFFPGDEQPTTFPGRLPLQHWWWWCVVLFLLLPLSPFFPAGANGRETNGHSNKEARLPPRLVSKPTEHLRKPSSASPPPLRKGGATTTKYSATSERSDPPPLSRCCHNGGKRALASSFHSLSLPSSSQHHPPSLPYPGPGKERRKRKKGEF